MTDFSADIVFYVPRLREEQLANFSQMDVDANSSAFAEGWEAWILQTCLLLKQAGFQTRFSREVLPRSLHIGHIDDMAGLGPVKDAYMVSVQADRIGFLPFVQATIVGNPRQADDVKKRYYLPHWPQPGLKPRAPGRSEVKQVAYAGRFANMGLSPHLFAESCRRCGLLPLLLGRDKWHDYSEIDILVGVRTLDQQVHDGKPVSKLVNAWLAGIPFIGGYDSAFLEAGEPEDDYLRVSSREGLEEAMVRLRDDPVLYRKLVANGAKKVHHYDRKAVLGQWTTLLSTELLPAFLKTEHTSRLLA